MGSATKMPSQPPQTAASTRTPVTNFLFDILRGAILGDFAHDLHVPGAITQAILGYVPVVGDIAAVRDLIHDTLYRDVVGVALNLLALIPVAGGIPKTVEVIRSTRHIHDAYRRSHPKAGQPLEVAKPKPSHAGIFSSWVTFLFGFASFSAGVLAALTIYYPLPGWPRGADVFVWLLGALPLALISLLFSLRGRLARNQRGLVVFGVAFSLIALVGVVFAILVQNGVVAWPTLPALSFS